MKHDIIKHLLKLNHTVIFINEEYFLVVDVSFLPEGIVVKGKNLTKEITNPAYLRDQSGVEYINQIITLVDNLPIERTQYSYIPYIWYQQ